MGKKVEELTKAHENLEQEMAQEEKTRLGKSLDALRSRFGFGQDNLEKANSTLTPGNQGFPNDQGAESRIASARGKSKPARLPDGNYEDLPSAEDDTTDYENSEDDALDGFGGRDVTDKSFKSQDEEDFYKGIIDGDPDGETVAAINATDALELLASTMGKSIAHVSQQTEAVGIYATNQFTELQKSLAVMAEALGTVMETLEKSASAFDLPLVEEPTRATGEESQVELGDEVPAEKSLSAEEKRYKKTLDFLQKAQEMNSPTFFSQLTGKNLSKSQGQENTPEDLNSFGGRQKVKGAITELIKSEGLNPDYLGRLDALAPSEVVASIPSKYKAKLEAELASRS